MSDTFFSIETAPDSRFFDVGVDTVGFGKVQNGMQLDRPLSFLSESDSTPTAGNHGADDAEKIRLYSWEKTYRW